MELLTPAVGLIIWATIIFLTVFFVLRKYAWTPILQGLKDRENEIDSALRMAEETRAEMAKLKADNEVLIAEARKERDKILAEAKDTSTRMITEAQSTAKEEAAKIISNTREAMAQERAAMVDGLRKEMAGLSIAVAEKLLRKELSDKKAQESLVTELLADVKLN